MATITLEHVQKVYGSGPAAVHDVTLEIRHGELLVLVGPSGSGKSTVLRLIAGLDHPTSGRILLDGDDMTEVSPARRDLAMVFQSYALYPHKSVRDNLAFGLKVRGGDPAVIRTRVEQAAAALGIDALLDRKPAQLSGGQRQRVALGRAIVREPRAFLLDEPLSNLDPSLRLGTRTELALLHRRLGATMVYVTHDQEEAMTLGTRLAVMREGRLEQVGTPLDVYRRPANVFVATFFGSPAMNVWPCSCSQRAGVTRLAGAGLAFEVAVSESVRIDDATVLAGVRPSDVELAPPDTADGRGHVDVIEPLGATTVVHVGIDGASRQSVRVVVAADDGPAVGDRVGIRVRRNRVHLFDARTGAALTPTVSPWPVGPRR